MNSYYNWIASFSISTQCSCDILCSLLCHSVAGHLLLTEILCVGIIMCMCIPDSLSIEDLCAHFYISLL